MVNENRPRAGGASWGVAERRKAVIASPSPPHLCCCEGFAAFRTLPRSRQTIQGVITLRAEQEVRRGKASPSAMAKEYPQREARHEAKGKKDANDQEEGKETEQYREKAEYASMEL